MGVAAQARVAEAFRVPVPADQFPAGLAEQVVPVRGRADVKALPPVLNDLELVPEYELDRADTGTAEPQWVL